MYNLVGGKIEKDNDGLNEAYRELKEETNLDIIDSTMVKVLSGKDTYREYPNGDKLYDITAIFVIKKYFMFLIIFVAMTVIWHIV